MGDERLIGIKVQAESDDAALIQSTDRLTALAHAAAETENAARALANAENVTTEALREQEPVVARTAEEIAALSKAQAEHAASSKAGLADLNATTDGLNDQREKAGDLGEGLGKLALKWISVAAAVEVAKKAIAALSDAYQSFVAVERLYGTLERNAKLFAGATEEETAALKLQTESMADMAGVGDEKVIPFMDRLLAVTHDVNDSRRLTQLAMDLEKQGLGDMQSTYMAITAAYEGMNIPARGFGRILISNHQEGETWIQTLDRLSDAMAKSAGEIADAKLQQDQLNESWKHAKEAIGELVGPLGGAFTKLLLEATYGIRALVDHIKELGLVVKFAAEEIGVFVAGIAGLAHGLNGFRDAQSGVNEQMEQEFGAIDDHLNALSKSYAGLKTASAGALQAGKDGAKDGAAALKALKENYKLMGLAAEAEANTEKESYEARHNTLKMMIVDTRLDLDTRLEAAVKLKAMEAGRAKSGAGAAHKENAEELASVKALNDAYQALGKSIIAADMEALKEAKGETAINAAAAKAIKDREALLKLEVADLKAGEQEKLAAVKGNLTARANIEKAFDINSTMLAHKAATDIEKIEDEKTAKIKSEKAKRLATEKLAAVEAAKVEVADAKAAQAKIEEVIASSNLKSKADYAKYFAALKLSRDADLKVATAELKKELAEAGKDHALELAAQARFYAAKSRADKKYFDSLFKMAKESANKQVALWSGMTKSVVSSFGSAIKGMIDRSMTFKDAMKSIASAILDSFIQMGENMLADWIEKQIAMAIMGKATEKATAVTQGTAQTQVWAINAASAVAPTPYVGPILAASAFAEAEAAGMAAVATAAAVAAKGGVFSRPTSVLLGEAGTEAVLPAGLTRMLMAASQRFGGGNVSNSTVTHDNRRGPTVNNTFTLMGPSELQAAQAEMAQQVVHGERTRSRQVLGSKSTVIGRPR